MEEFRPASDIGAYHAHIYYDPARTRDDAARLREGIGQLFPAARIGRWHDELVGPHTTSMFQVAFAVEDFPRIVPWLALNHRALSILIHPETDNGRMDHLVHALWIGKPLRVFMARLSGELPDYDGWVPYAHEYKDA